MKERFVFLFRPTEEAFRNRNYEKIVRDYCEKNNIPLSNVVLDDLCQLIPISTLTEVKTILPYISTTDVEIIVLLDTEKDIAYVYKGVGTLQEIKKGLFAKMVRLYEIWAKEFLILEEVRDLRDVYLRDAYLTSQQSPLLN